MGISLISLIAFFINSVLVLFSRDKSIQRSIILEYEENGNWLVFRPHNSRVFLKRIQTMESNSNLNLPTNRIIEEKNTQRYFD